MWNLKRIKMSDQNHSSANFTNITMIAILYGVQVLVVCLLLFRSLFLKQVFSPQSISVAGVQCTWSQKAADMGIYPVLSLFVLALVRPGGCLEEVAMGPVCARNNCCAADTVCATKVSCPYWQV